MSPAARLLALPVRAYRLLLSPWLGRNCRFAPTCSVYALEALEVHGALRGGALALRRVMRCHPWGGEGFDPVPPPNREDGAPGDETASETGRPAGRQAAGGPMAGGPRSHGPEPDGTGRTR